MATMTIRRALPEDVDALIQFRSDAIAYKLAHGDRSWGESGWTETSALARFSQFEIYIIALEEKPVGMVSLASKDDMFWGKQEPVAAYLHGLAVHSDFHGRGIGKFAIDWCVDLLAVRNLDWLRLDCDCRNSRLCAYYESLGFINVGTKPMPMFGDYVAALYERSIA